MSNNNGRADYTIYSQFQPKFLIIKSNNKTAKILIKHQNLSSNTYDLDLPWLLLKTLNYTLEEQACGVRCQNMKLIL